MTQSQLHFTLPCPTLTRGEITNLRRLFIDYSSEFNNIVPSKLITKLGTLGLNPSLCNWILDFLTGQPPTHDSNTIIKNSDITTVVGLITNDDESAYREEVRDLAVCQDNNLYLNVIKTKSMPLCTSTGLLWSG